VLEQKSVIIRELARARQELERRLADTQGHESPGGGPSHR
jgi:hypothetical protein